MNKNQDPPASQIYIDPQLHLALSTAYDLATRDHLAQVIPTFLLDAPLDDWPRYLRHAIDHLARYHPQPGPFLIHVAQQLNQAGLARILAA